MSQNVNPNDPDYIVQPVVGEEVTERVRAVPDQVTVEHGRERRSLAPWLLLALIACLALAYLLGRQLPGDNPTTAQTVLTCGETDVEIKTVEDYIMVTRNGETTNMPQVEAASGAKYESGDLVLWNEGANWQMIEYPDQPNEVVTPCTVH